MKSIKDETDQLYGIIQRFENATKEADQAAKEVAIFDFFLIILKILFKSGRVWHHRLWQEGARLRDGVGDDDRQAQQGDGGV